MNGLFFIDFCADLNVIGPVNCHAGDMKSCIPSESVDVVVLTHVMCSAINLDQCLVEIHRVLRKVGYLTLVILTKGIDERISEVLYISVIFMGSCLPKIVSFAMIYLGGETVIGVPIS